MDDLDRDKLYTSPASGPDSDDSDLELEPLDAEVLASAERRAAEAINSHRKSINIDEIYRDADSQRDSELLSGWAQRLREFRPDRFQFQVTHLLVLTAVVAIVLAVHRVFHVGFGTMLILAAMFAVAGISLLVKLEENRRQEEADRRRRRMYAERRAQQARTTGQSVEVKEDWDSEPLVAEGASSDPSVPPFDFRFRFSMSQLLMVITGAALLLGLVMAVGGAASIATFCGLAALAGLIVPALGLRPPEFVVFMWWMLLLVYVVLSLSTAIWTALSAG